MSSMSGNSPDPTQDRDEKIILGRIEAGVHIVGAVVSPEGSKAAPVTGTEGTTFSFMFYWVREWVRSKLGRGLNVPPPSN